MIRRQLTTALAIGWLAFVGSTAGQMVPTRSSVEVDEPAPRRVRGLLDIDLPRFDPPGTINLQFNPRFRDLLNRGYIRVPTGVRWTPNDDYEFGLEAETFFTHGLKHSATGNGFGELRFSGRRQLRRWPGEEFQSVAGINLEFPVGHPPIDMTDGRNHVVPFLTTERRSETRPNWTEFAGVSLDVISDSSVVGSVGKNTPRDDSISLTGGVSYQQWRLLWTVQGTYTTTVISGIDEHFFTLNPSVLWFVPRKYTFNSRTQWVVGFGARQLWGPDGREFSTSSRVRAEITFRQVLQKLRSSFEKQR